MGDFYGIEPGTIPGFAEAGGGKFIGVEGLRGPTVTNMVAFMEKLRRMHDNDRLACSPSRQQTGPALSPRSRAARTGR